MTKGADSGVTHWTSAHCGCTATTKLEQQLCLFDLGEKDTTESVVYVDQ
jgi:hypothetical protein